MKNLCKIECRKMLNKRNIIVILIMCLLAIGGYFFVYEKQSSEFYSQLIETLDKDVQNATINVEYIKSENKNLKGKELEDNNKLLDVWEKEKKYSDEILMYLKSGDIDGYEQRIIELFHERDLNVINYNKPQDISMLLRDDLKSINNRIDLYEYYHAKGETIRLNQKEPTLMYMLKNLSGNTFLFLLSVIIIIALNADIWSYEFSKSGYRLLFTIPYSKSTIYLSKVIVHFFVSLIAIVFVLMIPCILSVTLHGIGCDAFEIINQGVISNFLDVSNSSSLIVPIETYCMYTGLLFICYLIMAFSFINFISYITKDIMMSYTLPILLGGIVYINCQNSSSIFKFDLFSYYLGNHILNGDLHIGFYFAIFSLLLMSICFHAISLLLLKYRDMKEA